MDIFCGDLRPGDYVLLSDQAWRHGRCGFLVVEANRIGHRQNKIKWIEFWEDGTVRTAWCTGRDDELFVMSGTLIKVGGEKR